ncbi:hypothetical protein RRF57_001197 [Xylaria bambusicola]|uniref:Uncharacterized protein n=1 Tax=Xylaria bambusicola TaxID=326684 RepID=A0AAN7UGZ1_9PEZI
MRLKELQRKEDINEQESIVQTKREILASLEGVMTPEAATANGKLELAGGLPEILAWYIDGMGMSRGDTRFDRDWMPMDRDVGAKFAQAIAGNIIRFSENGQLQYVASVLIKDGAIPATVSMYITLSRLWPKSSARLKENQNRCKVNKENHHNPTSSPSLSLSLSEQV